MGIEKQKTKSEYKRKLIVCQTEDDKFQVMLEGIEANQHLRPMLRAAEKFLRIKLFQARPPIDLTVHRPKPANPVTPTEKGEPKPAIVTLKTPVEEKE